jgi:hypothetical protein
VGLETHGCFYLPDDKTDVATERRREGRRPWEPAPVRILIEGDPVGVVALIVNVSKSGIGMRVESRLPAGVKATVKTSAFIVTGTIRYCANNKNGGWFDLGFQIDELVDTQ